MNGADLDGDATLSAALKTAAVSKSPVELLVHDGKRFRTVRIDYQGGARSPHLERIPGTTDRLAEITARL